MKLLVPLLISTVLAGDLVLDKGDPAKGQAMYQRLCSVCHVIEPDKHGRLAPTLFGVVGRKAGTAAGYDIYSPAMQADGRAWTPETLDAYLDDPKAAIPGNFMKFYGIKDRYERADMIAYLGSLKGF